MNLAPGLILLQAQPESSPFQMLFPLAAIFMIFYFLLIRPQQKKQKAQEAMLKGIEKGDAVVTAGGLHGNVVNVSDDVLTVEIGSIRGDRLRVKVTRARIDHVDKPKKGESP